MADTELSCAGCELVVGICVENHCGHYFCHECTIKMQESNVLCQYCGNEDTEILSGLEDLSVERDIPVNCTTGMSLNNPEPNNQPPSNESVNTQHMMNVDDLQDDLTIRIDDALAMANKSYSQLNRAMQMVGNIKARNKVFEECVSRQIDEEFQKLYTALEARKSNLFAELREASDAFNVNLEKAVKKLEEQKKDMKSRVLCAEKLKASPEFTIYCNLNQLIADLMADFKNDHMIESLKTHPNIRFSINVEGIINILEKIGRISYDDTANQVMPDDSTFLPTGSESYPLSVEPMHENGATDVTETTCSMNFQCNLVQTVKNEYDLELEYQPCLQTVDSGNQTTSILSFKNKSLLLDSVPDVIIEQIIDEDFPNAELYSCKTKKLKKSERKMVYSPPFSQKKGNVELVCLSHIVNPCNFYIHRLSQNKQLIMLERSLSMLGRTCSHCSPCDILELGEIIAFRSSNRQSWYRGRITELIPLETKYIQKPCGPARYRVEDIARITLFLLDHGSSEIFIVTRFAGACSKKGDQVSSCLSEVNDLCRILTKFNSSQLEWLRTMPPFAVHCSLDIIPQTPDGRWTKEIRKAILKMINNRSVQMRVFREENNTLIVDLMKPVTSKMISDMPVSLRESLVFANFAKFPSKAPGSLEYAAVAHYKDPEFPKNMTEVVVLACHVNDPSDFYIHVIGGSEYIKVVRKIQDVYNNEDTEDWIIEYPVIGQACVAKFDGDDDDQWYRAEIIGLHSAEDVDISYVDFGNVCRVSVTKLRKLKDEFLVLPRKAICCRLAYIQPSHDAAHWSSDACKLFEELTSFKRLRCNFIGMVVENKLSVELFDVNPAIVISINSILVNSNVAAFIPCAPGSADPHLPLKEVWDSVLDRPLDSIEQCMGTISLSERSELDVYISHVLSPSKMFVQWLSSENILKSLESSMFRMYENSKPESTNWQVDMYVAVQMSSEKKWRRGKIKSIISEQLVEVFCYDFGMDQQTNVTNLRILDENLKIYGSLCLECTLMDIQPAGGCKTWTATACDFLSLYLNGATAKMIIEENASMWPLPVRILCKNEAGQLIDVSDFLVNKGLALRDRRLKPVSLMEVDKAASTSTKAHEYVKGANAESRNDKSDEENITLIDESAVAVNVEATYLPPLIPNETTFIAKVSHVAEDGTVYVIQECLDKELGILMLDMQNSFKCLGLMAPYNWKKGEGCIIKGSDTMSYRGRVLEILGGDMIKVQYEDLGFTEKIPKCHLYPSVFNQCVPRFCIPCQLIDVLPIGDHWQPDAIQFLKELVLERLVVIHLVEPPEFPRSSASIYLYCGKASVSAILEQYAYCIPKGCVRGTTIETQRFSKISHKKIWSIDFQELLYSDLDTPVLCQYSLLPLPPSKAVFKVKVTHIETPDRMFICIKNRGEMSHISNENQESDCDTVEIKLKEINNKTNNLPCLTDFKTEMPCLAMYTDNMLHRAKLVSVKSYDPVALVVEFVDYGSTAVLETCSLFQLPPCLIQYPARAIKVKLAGFRPPKEDFEQHRLPYEMQWSFRAMFEMMELVQGRTLFAEFQPSAAENTVCLFDEKLQPVHKPLLNMGLADPE
ncbi:RING finger protein 17 isoform X2 [Lithobates pipiens]